MSAEAARNIEYVQGGAQPHVLEARAHIRRDGLVVRENVSDSWHLQVFEKIAKMTSYPI
jgi:hypothetical protein